MDFGIGINTGTAVAGNMGSPERLEYSVIGSTVNLASRLTNAAPGGKVWISNNTYKLVQSVVEATSLGEMSIAGKKDTFQAYEVISLYPDSAYQEKIPVSAQHLIKLNASEMEV
jgi:class 3 adenylate cyclase